MPMRLILIFKCQWYGVPPVCKMSSAIVTMSGIAGVNENNN